ncbi:MAG: class I SAM-dependent methyltransferase, partial [Gemmatimonadota bacterium]
MSAEGTRERIVLEHHECSMVDYVISLMHTASYAFAETFTRGKRVLDYGCGSGYGAARIAETAGEVHAVDVSEDAIMYGRQHFERANLKFQCIDGARSLPFPDRAFETI